ncbi:hypothetical protein MSG28_013277, partial [Choristoneura fumiferana]
VANMLEGTKINSHSQMASIFDIAKDTVLFIVLSCYYVLESLFWTLGVEGGGAAAAVKLARLGARVVVWDINKEGLQKTCTDLTEEGYEVASYVVDLADRAAVGKVDVLINNAGTVFGETLLELSDTAIETTYKVNILSHYWP